MHCLAGAIGVSGQRGGRVGALLVAVAMTGVTHHGVAKLLCLLASWALPLSGLLS